MLHKGRRRSLTCPHCGGDNAGSAITCEHCGRTLRVDSWDSRLNELKAAEEKKKIDQSKFLQDDFGAKGRSHGSARPSLNASSTNAQGSPSPAEDQENLEAPELSVKENVCPKCGQITPEDSVFCVKCGQSLKSDYEENVESKVFEYISSHNGEISISQACKDMQLSQQDLLESIEKLKEKKMLAE